mmetsp:Transcript_50839/g.145261  ORF Transcript_50839/g.145261 Transcript_50839/m.145261 type:complete len:357 (-) Transcript_50839:151-1221(-)
MNRYPVLLTAQTRLAPGPNDNPYRSWSFPANISRLLSMVEMRQNLTWPSYEAVASMSVSCGWNTTSKIVSECPGVDMNLIVRVAMSQTPTALFLNESTNQLGLLGIALMQLTPAGPTLICASGARCETFHSFRTPTRSVAVTKFPGCARAQASDLMPCGCLSKLWISRWVLASKSVRLPSWKAASRYSSERGSHCASVTGSLDVFAFPVIETRLPVCWSYTCREPTASPSSSFDAARGCQRITLALFCAMEYSFDSLSASLYSHTRTSPLSSARAILSPVGAQSINSGAESVLAAKRASSFSRSQTATLPLTEHDARRLSSSGDQHIAEIARSCAAIIFWRVMSLSRYMCKAIVEA